MRTLINFAEWLFIGWIWTLQIGQAAQTLCALRPGDHLERFWRACGRVHQEVWLFVPPGLLALSAEAWSGHHWLIALLLAPAPIVWWRSRNWPEDNHWKRRAKKAKEAVAVRAGRLVVVPVGAPS